MNQKTIKMLEGRKH